MRIGIFTDSHYSSAEITCQNRYNSKSLEKIRDAFRAFKKENCNIVISLGDLIDREDDHEREIENLKEISEIIKAFQIPTVAVMGNHDAFAFTGKEFYDIVGMECRPYDRKIEGKNLVFMDACYYRNGRHYQPGDSDWTNTYFPEVNEFEKQISQLTGEVYVFMHQNIDPLLPETYRLSNADAIRDVIEKSGKVQAVYQGHYHKGNHVELHGVKYVTFPAMCSNDNAYFVIEV